MISAEPESAKSSFPKEPLLQDFAAEPKSYVLSAFGSKFEVKSADILTESDVESPKVILPPMVALSATSSLSASGTTNVGVNYIDVIICSKDS